jgi:HAD superfamily hydrolase (TIGR01509 family)
MIKAIIFDMDGVLIDAKEWHYEAFNLALELFGYSISKYDHLNNFDGLPTKKKLEMLTIDRGLPKGLHSFINEMKQQFTTEIAHVKCKPTFNHEFALSQLKAKGYKLAVASNSIRQTVELLMNKSNLDKYLEFYLSNEDVQSSKPNPEIYDSAIKKLGLHPHECLILEDNPNGIKAAQESGAHLMIINDIQEVNFVNIVKHIERIEGYKK